MPIKPSAKVGEAIRHLLAEKDMINEQMADDLNISKQLVSHYKNDRRTMQQDIAKQSIRVYEDSPEYIGELLYKFSDGYTSPVLKGPAIERHRLALKAHAEG
ncbi:helix-turn-helix transcriptional regulator [Bacillus badius]|uniref:helix-turn-helix domain-containing protein n=1 Tax=Bacillus badius TaxID=1455 RepID=UPI002E1DB005|nr:helix-turn-helix transcriptional regulator [Bacillus badius]